MKMYLVGMMLVCVSIFGAGCGKRGDSAVLATIDQKETITLAEFNDRISNLPLRYKDIVTKNKKEFLDELIVDRLIYRDALRKKLDKDKDVRRLLAEAKRKIMMARLLQNEIQDAARVNEKEIEDYYDSNKGNFTAPETLRASHILVKTKEDAEGILVELSNGRNFEDLARARSIDASSKGGGDIGYFTKKQLVPEFEEACFSMEAGEISGAVKTQFGYHIIKLTEKKRPRVKELTEVRDSIEASLGNLKKKTLFKEFVTDLKEKSQIVINAALLEDMAEEEAAEEK